MRLAAYAQVQIKTLGITCALNYKF